MLIPVSMRRTLDQAALAKTFFLNFGKKGELKEIIKGLKKEIKAESKSLEKAEKVAEKAMGTKDVRIDQKLNKHIWSKGIRNLPRRVRVLCPSSGLAGCCRSSRGLRARGRPSWTCGAVM